MEKIPAYKQLLSLIYPVSIRKSSSKENPVLELFLYQGQFQLATEDAIYSDGKRYEPLVLAFKKLRSFLPVVKDVLVLGTGLGSAVHILEATRHANQPHYTLVDNDEKILKWAGELFPQTAMPRINTICADAEVYVNDLTQQFDLVVVDIFKGMIVPAFVGSEAFIKNVRRSVRPGGHLVLNVIAKPENDWEKTLANFNVVFPKANVITAGVNRILVATV